MYGYFCIKWVDMSVVLYAYESLKAVPLTVSQMQCVR